MNQRTVFHILDADTEVKASISENPEQGSEDHIVLSRPDHNATIILSLSDFRRMVAAVERRY